MLSQFVHAGFIKATKKNGARGVTYTTTTDSPGMSPQDMLNLWRIATQTPKTNIKHTKKKQQQPKPEPEPAPPPEPETVDVDILEVLRHVLRSGSLDLLVQAAREEFGVTSEDQGKIQALEERILHLERQVNEGTQHVTSLHEANRRLREEQFNDRKKMQDLRAQIATGGGTKIIEKIVQVAAVPKTGIESGGGQGFRYPRTHGIHGGSSGKASGIPHHTPGGTVAVFKKKRRK